MASFREEAEALHSETLEGVRGCSRLEGATTKHPRPRILHLTRDRGDLIGAFHRTRTAHDHDLTAADGYPPNLHHRGISIAKLARNELVRLKNRGDRLHPGHRCDGSFTNSILRSDHPDHG